MMTTLSGIAVLVGQSFAASVVAQATLIGIGSLLTIKCLRRQPAANRHVVLATGFALLLILPVCIGAGRWMRLDMPVHIGVRTGVESAGSFDTWGDFQGAASFDLSPIHISKRAIPWRGVLFAGWAAGAAACLVPLLLGFIQMRRYRRFGVPAHREQSALDAYLRQIGVKTTISLLRHESIPGPMTYGLFHPVVFIPAASSQWNAAVLHSALVHETEHVRRGDWLVHCASRLVCALYWFHPLVWAMRRNLALEAERACDDAVLVQTDAADYADQLVDLAERLSAHRRLPLLAMAGRDDLRVRVAAVLNPSIARGRTGTAAVVMAFVAAVIIGFVAPIRAVTLKLPSTAAAPSQFYSLAIDVPGVPDVVASAVPSGSAAQQAVPPPSPPAIRFAVASVKVNQSGEQRIGAPPVAGGRFVRTNIPIDVLIATAYAPLQRFEIDGVPEWTRNTRVDIEAVADGAPTPSQISAMLQALLADRFQLVVHREARQQPIYAFVVARVGQLGPQLQPHTDNAGCVDPASAPNVASAIDPNRPLPPAPCGAFRGNAAIGRMAGQDVSLDTFGRALSGQLGRMVVDRTGLTGKYDLLLEWTPQQQLVGIQPAAVGTADRPSIFTAVQEQLGLKLDPQMGPVNMLVVDLVELPTEN
jgi:bla regulator protein blaR1